MIMSWAERLRHMLFFGFDHNKHVVDQGMNAKMTEVSAGLGLANLNWLDRVRQNRRQQYQLYCSRLEHLSALTFQTYDPAAYNYSYMPVLFADEEILLQVMAQLVSHQIYPRRYFYPALNTVSIFQPQATLPIAESVSRRILCLPLYDSLSTVDIDQICEHIIQVVDPVAANCCL